tara:strand:+ start:333 stop:689 length:357 start_codon:yes stop_codon:yes gene_type:complete
MRFQEFQSTNKELESALVNTLTNMRGDADDDQETAEISFPALDQLMKNTGYPTFNYNLFKTIYDQSETLKNVVDDFDQEKVVVKTAKQAEKDPEMDFDNQGSTDVVKKMAKSAMNKRK